MSGKRARAATTQHVLKPVTVMPHRGGRKRQEYVDVSSSDSEHQPQRPPPKLKETKPAIPPTKKQSRTRIPPKESAPPPVRSPSPPPPPPPPAKIEPPVPSSRASRSRRKLPRPALEAYAHTVHVSRHQVEQEWILLSDSMRAHLRSEVEQVAKETLESVSAGRSPRDRAMRKHLESTFARFADEFDDLMATLPVPPLPPGLLPPNLLGPPEPDSGSKPSASSSSSKKEKKLKMGEDDKTATAADATLAKRSDSDVVGDGRDWSLEALEAYLEALENRAEQAEAAAAAAECDEEAAAITVKAKVKRKAAAAAKGKEKEEEEEEKAPRLASSTGKGNKKGSRSRKKAVEEKEEEAEEDDVPKKRVRKKQGTSRAK